MTHVDFSVRTTFGSRAIFYFHEWANTVIGNESVSSKLHMMTSSRDKGFIQISSDHPSIDAHLPFTLNTAPLLQINRLVWHYSSGTYRSANVCSALRQVRATLACSPLSDQLMTLICAHKLKKLPLDNFHLCDIFM